MACNIEYNQKGRISKVNKSNGEESKLFNEIASLPHVNTLEDALEIYKVNYADGNEIENNLNFKSDKGVNYSTFKEALKNSYGGDIEISAGGKVLASVSSNSNPKEIGGLINNLIKADVLSDTRIIENGESFLKAEGYDNAKQLANEIQIREAYPNATFYKDGRIELKEKVQPEADNSEQGQLLSKLNNVIKELQPKPYGLSIEPTVGEEGLQARLIDFLNNIGVKITSIEEYSKNYNTRNGVEPSSQALADIANQIVAFKDGKITTESLSEETAHFIIEAWNQDEIQNLLRNIHKTDSYQKHAQTYREIYTKENPNMSAEEIEQLVRKEILGKELSNALINRFSTEGKNETQVNILRRIYDLFVDFFNNLVLNDDYRAKLEDLTLKVEDLLLSQDIAKYIDTTQYKGKKFRLYSVAPNQKTVSQVNLLNGLIEQEKTLLKIGKGSVTNLKKLEGMLMSEIEKGSLQDLINLSKRQIRYIKDSIEAANRRNTSLSNEENIVFRNLNNVIRPALAQLSVGLKSDPTFKTQVSEMEELVKDISMNEGLVLNAENDILDKIIDRVIKRYSLEHEVESEDADGNVTFKTISKTIRVKDENGDMVDMNVRDYLKNSILATKNDTNALYSYFGQITHASDPLLNLLGSVIGDIYIDAGNDLHDTAKKFQQELKANGLKESDLSKLIQEDGYITSKWDFAAFEEFKTYARVEAYQKYLDDIIDNVKTRISKGEKLQDELSVHEANKAKSTEELIKDFKGFPVISSEILRTKVNDKAAETINSGEEGRLSEEYLKKQKQLLDNLNISDVTRAKLKGFAEIRSQIKRNTIKSKEGVSIYTVQNKYDLQFLNLLRRKASSPYTEFGDLKEGLSVNTFPATNESVKISDTEYLSLDRSTATEEAIISFDMNKMTRHFIEEKKSQTGDVFNEKLDRTTHAKFYSDLEAMNNDPEVKREDILDFFNLNTQVGFSKEFFDGERENLFADFENDPDISDKIDEYRDLLAKRRAVVNQYKDSNNGVNTLADNMTSDVKKEILSMTLRIEDLASNVFMYIKGKNKDKAQEIEREERDAETGANEAYFGALKDNNLITFDEKLKFTLEHMTERNKKKVEEYKEAVKNGYISSKMQPNIDKYGNSEEGVLRYAQSRLLPYYASYAPRALQEFYDKARNTNEDMISLIEELNADPNVRISVSYDYLDSTDDSILNPNREKDFKGGFDQPSLTKKPTVLGKTFDFKNKNWNKIESDPKLKKLHDMYVELQSKTLENYGEEVRNVYLAPQVHSSTMEKAFKSLKGKDVGSSVKEWLVNMKNYRADELARGAEAGGKALIDSGIKIIPKYYLNKIEDPKDVSTDLFYSSMLMYQQSALYKSRKEKYADISALYDAVSSNQRRYPNGKQASATNTYRVFKSYMDYALFGVQEQASMRVSLPILGQVDLAKAIRTLHKYKQALSLGLNITIPATSALTAHVGLFTERLIGQYIDQDSMNKANREFAKISGEAMTEGLAVRSDSRLSIIGEFMNVFDLDKRFENSKYNKFARTLGKSVYILHTLGNFVPLSTAMLSILQGNRIYAGKILDYNQFKTIRQNSGNTITESDIKAEWKNLKSIYSYMKTDKGYLEYDPQLYTDLGVDEKEFKNLEKGFMNKSKALMERIDGQISTEERVVAQRNSFLSYIMSHRGWLSIAMANRFKSRHLNLKSGLTEQGTYLTAANYVKDLINSLSVKDWEGVKNQWKNLSDEERVNMQRILKELGVLSAITMLAIGMSSWGDDEEDSYIAQLADYLSTRVRNETTSAQGGIVRELYTAIKEPIVSLSQLENMAKVNEIISTDKVTTGRYAGLSQSNRYIIRNLIGAKSVYDLWDAKNLKSQKESYKHFQNEELLWTNPLGYLLTKDEK